MDKNDREKKLLKDFAANSLNNNIFKFSKIDLLTNSYYICRDDKDEYIREYDFNTAIELREELERLWEGDDRMMELTQPMVVAAMKNKPLDENLNVDKNVESIQVQEQNEKLVAYIYNF